MRLLDYLFALVALAGLAMVSWWGVYQSPQSAVKLENRLEAAAQSALATEGYDWAKVEMSGQRAVLRGAAPSDDAVQAAAQRVLASSGAGGLLRGGVTVIESQVDAAPPVSPFKWRAVKTDSGKVILLGHVPSSAIRGHLVDAVTGLDGVSGIDDRMILARGAPMGNWQGVARLALGNLMDLETGEARLTDTRLTVRGVSMDDAVKARVSADVANLTAPFRGEPSIRSPSLWAAEHGDGVLVLTGQIATETERDQIVSVAKQYYAQEVRDEMVVGGNPHRDWVEGVRLGMPHFARFRSGEMGFSPADEGFSFEGEASGSTLEYLRQDMQKMTGPWAKTDFFADAVQVDVAEIAGIDFSGDPVMACQQAFDQVLTTNTVVFDSGQATITRESGVTLDKLMAVSGRCDRALRFELGGHTDNSGDRDANIVLSEARAGAVVNYMVAAEFARDRLSAIGYGPDIPVAGNDSPEGRAKNRRIEFKVLERSN